MKKTLIRLLMTVSVMILVNFESQSVWAAPSDEEKEASEMEESTSLDQTNETKENEEDLSNEEIVEVVPENELVVSDKLLIEPKKPHAGEQVSFKLSLPEESDFTTIVLSYLSSETKTGVDVALTYDSETKLYEGKLETDSGTDVGIWQFTKAVGIDRNKATSILETTLLTNEIVELKQGDYEVIPHPASLLDLSSIKVEPKPVKINEKLQFSMKSMENTALTNVTVIYRAITKEDEKMNRQLTLSLIYNEETKAYEGEFAALTPNLVGDWVIEYISASDAKGNSYKLSNQFVIESDKEKLQKDIVELQEQIIEKQAEEELVDTAIQQKNDALEENIQQLEASIAAKEKLLQADLSIGNFTIEENLVDDEINPIDEEIPAKNEESLAETESSTSLTKPNTAVSKEDRVTDLDDEQKNEENSSSVTSENNSAVEESVQVVDTTAADKSATKEEADSTAFSKGSLFIVLAAFVIINGFIFKF